MDLKAKKKMVRFDYKLLDGTTPNESGKGILYFLNETAPLIEGHFPKYTGSVTLHIRDGKLASWESKAGGRYKD